MSKTVLYSANSFILLIFANLVFIFDADYDKFTIQ